VSKKPIFTDVLQVGVVVKNLEASMKKYYDDYGIGPWTVYEFNKDTVQDMIIRDKKVNYAMRLALVNIGKVQWELIEPLDDISIYAEFLKEHGEGLHHVALGVENYEGAMAFARGKDIGIIQGGTWHDFIYTYLDTADELATIAEIYRVPEGFEWPPADATYP
jgi:hypothetical protein